MQRTQEESCRRFCHLGQLSALPRLAISGPHGAAWPPWAAGRAFPSRFHEPPFCRRATANHRGALGMQRPLSPGVRSTSIQPPVAALAHKAESGTPVAHAHSGAGSERLSGARRMSPLLGGVPVIFCIVLYHRPPGHMLSWARPAPAPAGCWLWPCCRSLLFCASAILRRLALNLPLLWISPTAASRADETAPDFLLCSCAARFLSFTRPEYPLDISFFLCLVGALCRCISSHLLSIIASAPSASSRD